MISLFNANNGLKAFFSTYIHLLEKNVQSKLAYSSEMNTAPNTPVSSSLPSYQTSSKAEDKNETQKKYYHFRIPFLTIKIMKKNWNMTEPRLLSLHRFKFF